MGDTAMGDEFYERLPRETVFDRLTDDATYTALPTRWYLGVADIVNSTGEVAAGRYKTVNMVGAAVVSAVMNTLKGRAFPFVFGGDGASFAIHADDLEAVEASLAAVCRWADAEFDIGLRAALVPVSDALAAGHSVRVARFQASEGADYAMFSGGGLLWAETEMKAGRYLVDKAPVGTVPDLTGLSCRWAQMPAKQDTILSLVVSPVSGVSASETATVYGTVIAIASGLERGGHPAPSTGMEAKWPPKGATLEAHAARQNGSLLSARCKSLFESFVAWALIKSGLSVAGFDARRYARVVADNADFRKLDDGLKMTLDCDNDTRSKLEKVLSEAQDAGVIRYGIATQDEAMMTCIVPSIMTDDHLHFIDGASGGYTKAASQMKAR